MVLKPAREHATNNAQTYFVTSDTWKRRPLFRAEPWARLFFRNLLEHRGEAYLLHEFVLMPDHFHVLFTPSISLERAVQLVKGGFSYRAKRELGSNAEIWHRGFSDHRIRDAEDYDRHVYYIRLNPVKKHLCERPEEYKYSSVYPGWKLDPIPQGLKPQNSNEARLGTAKAVPFQNRETQRRTASAAPFQSGGRDGRSIESAPPQATGAFGLQARARSHRIVKGMMIAALMLGAGSGMSVPARAQLSADPPYHLSHLRGIFVDAKGNPIPGAALTLDQNDKVICSTTTNQAGKFEIKHVSGHFWLHVDKKGYSTVDRQVIVGLEAETYLHGSTLYVIAGPGACSDDCSTVFTSKAKFEQAIRSYTGHYD
jgi:putative transposase